MKPMNQCKVIKAEINGTQKHDVLVFRNGNHYTFVKVPTEWDWDKKVDYAEKFFALYNNEIITCVIKGNPYVIENGNGFFVYEHTIWSRPDGYVDYI